MASKSSTSKSKGTVRQFEYVDEKSSKFWEIAVVGLSVTVRFGKIGTEGQVQEKVFETQVDADTHASKLITEKVKKGYVETRVEVAALPKKIAAAGKKPVKSVLGLLREVERKILGIQKRFKSLLEKYADYDWVKANGKMYEDEVACVAPCWNVKTRANYPESADRTASMLSGPFFCCLEYPWPMCEGAYMEPVVQLDLRVISKLRGLDFGDGVLQVFYDPSNMDPAGLLRVIPREVIESEEASATPLFKGYPDSSGRTPTDWCEAEGTFKKIVGFSKPLISSAAEIDAYIDDLPNDLKMVCRQITAMRGNDYSFHMFGTFAPVQYGGDERPSCLMNFNGSEHGYYWGDGSAQVFYEFVDGKVRFTFEWSCG